ncbi:MAG: glutathione S-transferase [Pseudomonadota bacterium]
MSNSSLVLHTFYFSNYCEKVKWALQYKQMPFRERYHLPFLHMRHISRISGQTAVPVISLGDQVTAGSAAIIQELEEQSSRNSLYPSDQNDCARALAWQDQIDAVGPSIRGAMFHDFLGDRYFFFRMLTAGQSGLKFSAYKLFFYGMFPRFRKMLNKHVPDPEGLRHKTLTVLDQVAKQVEKRGYLAGDQFSIADLTAASLLYPLFFPPSTPGADIVSSTPVGRTWLARWNNHPVKDYVASVYARHR